MDRSTAEGDPHSILEAMAIAALEGFFRFWMRKVLIGVSREIEYDLRNDIFAHLQKMSLAFFQSILSAATAPAAFVALLASTLPVAVNVKSVMPTRLADDRLICNPRVMPGFPYLPAMELISCMLYAVVSMAKGSRAVIKPWLMRGVSTMRCRISR